MPQLIQALSNKKASKMRIAAAEALVNLTPVAKAATPDLIVGLADRDVDVRKAMVACLVATEPAVSDLLPLLADQNLNVRGAVADALMQIGSKTVPILSETVSQWCTKPKANVDNLEKQQKITEVALQVLGKFGRDASVSVPTIAIALVDPSPIIKLAAVQALEKIDRNWMSNPVIAETIASLFGVEVAVSKLVIGLADRDVNVREAMVACLGQFGAAAEPAVPDILLLLSDCNSSVREAVVNALRQIGPQAVTMLVKIVLQWLTQSKAGIANVEKHRKITGAALQMLGKFGPKASVAMPTIVLALADSNQNIKFAAVQALANIDRNWMSNPVAVETIAKLAGQQSKVESLDKIAGEIVVQTFTAIGAIAVPVLIDALKSGDQVTRLNAAVALGRIGAEAKVRYSCVDQSFRG